MPKLTVSHYRKEFFINGKKEAVSKLCNVPVAVDKTQGVQQHRNTTKHLQILSELKDQILLPSPHKFDYPNELVKSFLSANIPLNKLQNLDLQNLLQKMGFFVPSVTKCRKIVDSVSSDERERIPQIVDGKTIFLVEDESIIKQKQY